MILWGHWCINARFGRKVSRWIEQLEVRNQVLLALFMGLQMIAMQIFMIEPSSPERYQQGLTAVGALMGSSIGFALERKFLKFCAVGSLKTKILRYLLGITLIGALYVGLSTVAHAITETPGLIEGSIRVFRYALIGFFLAFLAPWMFLKLGLAEREC